MKSHPEISRHHMDMLANLLRSHLQIVDQELRNAHIKPEEETASSLLLEVATGFATAEMGYGPTSGLLHELAKDARADRVQAYFFK